MHFFVIIRICAHFFVAKIQNSKLIEVVTVADVDADDNVGNSLLQFWELMFGPKAKLLFRLLAQGLVKILNLKFRQDFEAVVCSAFCR